MNPLKPPFIYGFIIFLAILLSLILFVFWRIDINLIFIVTLNFAIFLRAIITKNFYFLWIIPFSFLPFLIKVHMDARFSLIFFVFGILFFAEGVLLYSKNIRGIKNGKYQKT